LNRSPGTAYVISGSFSASLRAIAQSHLLKSLSFGITINLAGCLYPIGNYLWLLF